MRNYININSFYKKAVFIMSLLLIMSCVNDDPTFDFDLLPSHKDGIQNLDETGVDCGGSSGVTCPTCDDGIQNQDEDGVDCGGICDKICPKATPRFDALASLGLPYYNTFETDFANKNLPSGADGTFGALLDYAFASPLGEDELVGRYTRPEGAVSDGFSDFKFAKFDEPIDFSEFNKFRMDIYVPSSNDFTGSLVPQAEVILYDSTNPMFWETWTILSTDIAEGDFDSWQSLKFNGGDALANSTIYDGIAIRLGGSAHEAGGVFYIKDFVPTKSFVQEGTPRADAFKSENLPYYFTFEKGDDTSGLNLIPRSEGDQGVDLNYGVADPAGSDNGVTQVLRPSDGRFGGFEDFKFMKKDAFIDFSEYHMFKLDVFIPSTNDFSGQLQPMVELIFHDNDTDFFNRWTVLVKEGIALDQWVTLEFDGTTAIAGEVLLPNNNAIYDNVTLRFGGSNHFVPGEFYIKDFIPVKAE